MKKMMTLIICAVVALSITACASSGTAAKTPITETTAITEATAITETTAITEITAIPKSTTPANTNPDTMIANPFVDCQTMETAAEVAGFEFRTPEQVEGISEKKIQAVDQEMIQVIYSADENQILIRKAPGTRNISGDYNNYQKEETITVDERQVTLIRKRWRHLSRHLVCKRLLLLHLCERGHGSGQYRKSGTGDSLK